MSTFKVLRKLQRSVGALDGSTVLPPAGEIANTNNERQISAALEFFAKGGEGNVEKEKSTGERQSTTAVTCLLL